MWSLHFSGLCLEPDLLRMMVVTLVLESPSMYSIYSCIYRACCLLAQFGFLHLLSFLICCLNCMIFLSSLSLIPISVLDSIISWILSFSMCFSFSICSLFLFFSASLFFSSSYLYWNMIYFLSIALKAAPFVIV